MAVTITPTDDVVMATLRAFVLGIVPVGVEVFQGQANRVPEPVGVDFIVMTPSGRNRLSTNTNTWDATGTDPVEIASRKDTEYTCQLDFHGPAASDLSGLVATLIRDPYACDQMADTGVTPLHATDAKQMPFINGEAQYENRWVVTVSLQITPTVSTPMQFADRLAATVSSALGGV